VRSHDQPSFLTLLQGLTNDGMSPVPADEGPW
jgi:hypothetical protein